MPVLLLCVMAWNSAKCRGRRTNVDDNFPWGFDHFVISGLQGADISQ